MQAAETSDESKQASADWLLQTAQAAVAADPNHGSNFEAARRGSQCFHFPLRSTVIDKVERSGRGRTTDTGRPPNISCTAIVVSVASSPNAGSRDE